MANPIIGRTGCPECGFGSAHVRESAKCLYRYCPECGSQHHARTERQRTDLLEKMRPAGGAPEPAPAGETKAAPAAAPAAAVPTPTPTATPTPAKRRGLWG